MPHKMPWYRRLLSRPLERALPRAGGRAEQLLTTGGWLPGRDIVGTLQPFDGRNLFLGRANGRYIGYLDDRHMLTVAGSRAGKDTSLIVPGLLHWPGSAIAIDPKAELATLTASRRGGSGSEWAAPMPGARAFALDPFLKVSGPAVACRGSFNPLARLDAETEHGFELAGMIADALVIQQEGAAAHWTLSARAFLRALILYIAAVEPPETRHLVRMREVLLEIAAGQRGQDPGDTVNHMLTLPGPIRHGAQGLAGKPPAERASVLSTCDVQTDFLEGEAMGRVLTGHDFDLEDMKRETLTIYLCLPANRLGTHGRWLRMMVALALDAMERTGPLEAGRKPVLFCLDEFAALGYMPVIEAAAGQIASFGVKLWPILQDLTQLQRDYREGWETFMGNAGLMTFFGNTDLTTCRHVSARLGMTHLEIRTAARQQSQTYGPAPGGDVQPMSGTAGSSEQSAFQTVPVLYPDEVQRYFARETGRMIALTPSALPIILERCPYHLEAHDGLFGGLYDPAPGHPLPRVKARR